MAKNCRFLPARAAASTNHGPALADDCDDNVNNDASNANNENNENSENSENNENNEEIEFLGLPISPSIGLCVWLGRLCGWVSWSVVMPCTAQRSAPTRLLLLLSTTFVVVCSLAIYLDNFYLQCCNASHRSDPSEFHPCVWYFKKNRPLIFTRPSPLTAVVCCEVSSDRQICGGWAGTVFTFGLTAAVENRVEFEIAVLYTV